MAQIDLDADYLIKGTDLKGRVVRMYTSHGAHYTSHGAHHAVIEVGSSEFDVPVNTLELATPPEEEDGEEIEFKWGDNTSLKVLDRFDCDGDVWIKVSDISPMPQPRGGLVTFLNRRQASELISVLQNALDKPNLEH